MSSRGKGRWWPIKVLEGVGDANGEDRELVSKDPRPTSEAMIRDFDAVQSEFGVGYGGGY